MNPSVRRAGEWAVETGRFVSVLTALTGGASGRHEGAYLVIWRNESDGIKPFLRAELGEAFSDSQAPS